VPSKDASPIAASPAVDRISLGWREWVGLPGLGIGSIKAKLDSGARSSSLHVEAIETFREGGVLQVRFRVRLRRKLERYALCTAPVLDRRRVTDSGGHRSERWFIATELEVAGRRFATEMNLTDRGAMLFPLLLGRSAISGRFRIDPALSYTCPRPARAPTGHPPLRA
jgi:hypothetical protein